MKRLLFGLAVVFAIIIYGGGIMRITDKKQSAEARHSAEQVNNITNYVVKEYNGRVALFIENEAIPLRFLKIDVSQLNGYDKQQFKRGLQLKSIEEVLLLEEDFSS